jgi:hypothetical protein
MLMSVAGGAVAQSGSTRPTQPLKVNQTDGFGKDRLLAFTYFMNFACLHEPGDDLDNNGKQAAEDPEEFQTPRCVVGGSEPSIDPAGKPIDQTLTLYVLVPFFDADNDGEAASPELANALRGLFGFVPDAFDPTPGVPVQCPEPGQPRTQQAGAFGTCTMHPVTLDMGPVLSQLGLVPAGTPVQVPTPNHSHIIDRIHAEPVWWHIEAVLVTDPTVWPDADGTVGITSLAKMRRAQAEGKAFPDVPTNLFLFFDSNKLKHGVH